MSDNDRELVLLAEKKAQALVQKLKSLSVTLALAESCTAGLVSSLLAQTQGASSVLWGSYVCYTQEAKVSMLNLDNEKLLAHGLVSKETVLSMAESALRKSGASLAAAVTGLAGPDGDGSENAVGTVWIAVAVENGETRAKEHHFDGTRNIVRYNAAIAVIETVLEHIVRRG